MRFRYVLILFVLVLSLAACDAALPGQVAQPTTAAQAPGTAGTPDAAGGPRANRTPSSNFTPGAQGTRNPQRAQGTPAANSTPSNNVSATAAPTLVAPTAVVINPITQTNGVAPTAVPIPTIVIPTPLPSTSDTSTAPAPTPVPGTNTSGTAPLPTIAPPPATQAGPSLESLRGKIVFFSDRGGLFPQLYVMNPDGSNPQLCNCSDLLPSLVNADLTSPDKQQFLFVKQLGGARNPDFQIWAHNNQTKQDTVVTGGPPGFPGVDYDPTWSPDARHIAWVTEANGYDEIYVYDRTTNENNRLTQSHGEWYKHPSYSPDGSQLTYWTNLNNINQKQIWVMSADGSGQHNISNNPYNDWDPLWVK